METSKIYVCDLCFDSSNIHALIKQGKCVDDYCDTCRKNTWHCEYERPLTQDEYMAYCAEHYPSFVKTLERVKANRFRYNNAHIVEYNP